MARKETHHRLSAAPMKPEALKGLGSLQNGSDIRGVAMEGIPGEKVTLTPALSERLGGAFASWLGTGKDRKTAIAVGTDSRISGPMLKKAFMQGAARAGCDMLDFGLASTPAMFMATLEEELQLSGSVMLTASHLPFNRNGMKFFTRHGGLDKADISELLRLAESVEPAGSSPQGRIRSFPFLPRYALFLVETIRRGVSDPDRFDEPLKGLKILVDAGNGAGGFFADQVLLPLGADTSGSLFLEPDGYFPNHVPNPEDNEAMDSICRAVRREKADLGIIFDTDVDRAALVDSGGNAINRNDLIALLSSIILEEHPGSVVVTDSITSSGLTWFIEEHLGGTHHRFMRGYRNVINESIRLNRAGRESWLAIETSGHAALKENHFLDDGAYLVSKTLIRMARLRSSGRTLADLIKPLPRPLEEREFRLPIRDRDFKEYGNRVLADLGRQIASEPGWIVEDPNYEGLRIRSTIREEEGWFLIRLSLHDPVMPLNMESSVKGGIRRMATRLRKRLDGYTGLNLTNLIP